MSKLNINILVIYLIISLFTYQLNLISLPLSINVILFPLAITIYFFFSKNSVRSIKFTKTIFLIILICIYILFSLLHGDNKIEVLEKLITFEITMLLIFYILYNKLNENYIEIFLTYTFYLSSIYIVISFLMIDSLVDYKGDFDGFLKMTHNISFLLSIYFILIVSFLKMKEKVYYYFLGVPILIIDLNLIYFTKARIGFFTIGIFFFTILIYKYIRLKTTLKIFYLIIFIFFLLFLYKEYILIIENDYILYLIERGLTGRDEISNILINFLMDNIFITFTGFGIGSLDFLATKLMPHAVHDTNNIIGIIFELGIIGLILFISLFSTYLYQVNQIIKYEQKIDYLLFIPMPMIFNFSETTWINITTFETIISYVFIAYTFKKYNLIKRKKYEN